MLKQDGVCNPVSNVSALSEASSVLDRRQTFRPGQQAPAGCKISGSAVLNIILTARLKAGYKYSYLTY